ncbi:hypothetical protein [Amycolatopsis azurea]|uniref:Uncharacterized protein n=1 Tax=Amycolatopsis azurea DSM 43854 TaxID=1238180 RepID=M2QH95_9PSEU|nr:hypothetical protein [Amycolatopsis azurea]EMD26081.1 hypothetical protein C791_3873 [Amycolatopsis azurea DSM 43854]
MTTSASPQDLETARLLLNRLGVDPAELLATSAPEDGPSQRRPMPTIREWIPVVAALLSPSTAASYGSYWAKAEAVCHGNRGAPLHDSSPYRPGHIAAAAVAPHAHERDRANRSRRT